MLNKEKFGVLMQEIAEIVGKDFSKGAISLYYDLLKGYDFKDVRDACEKVLKTHKYPTFPLPAEIIGFLEEPVEAKGLEAWNSVLKAIRRYGYYHSINFEDKTIHMVVDALGGWGVLCNLSEKEISYTERQFVSLYKLYTDHPRPYPEALSAGGLVGVSAGTVIIPALKSKKQLPVGKEEL